MTLMFSHVIIYIYIHICGAVPTSAQVQHAKLCNEGDWYINVKHQTRLIDSK